MPEQAIADPDRKEGGAAAEPPPFIRIEGVTKKFGDFTAVDNVTLHIRKGEIFSLLGGSGCGKTTLLRMLAGFEEPTKGQAALSANGRWPSLHQLAHVQVIHPDDITRLGQLGAMANMQSLWARWDPVVPDYSMDLIGPARAPLVYAFRKLLDAGARYCLSSDFPVTTLNPFEIMETAVTRQAMLRDGPKEPFFPAECLSIEEAVAGYTCHAADACWRGDFTGRLRPGFSADAIILDRDIFACPATEISQAEVLLTLFEGREVWRNENFDG